MSQSSGNKPAKGALLRLRITDLAYGGQGVGRLEGGGLAVFVEQAAPGDLLDARIVRVKSNFAEAVIERVVEPAPERVAPPCPLFTICGGCNYQHLDYAEQLRYKRLQVQESVRRIGRLERVPEVEPVVPSPAVYHYRNKMEYTFGEQDGRLTLGFHLPNQWKRVFDVERCLLHPPAFDGVMRAVREFAGQTGLAPYNRGSHCGFWRHLVLRHSVAAGKIIGVVITAPEGDFDFDALTARLARDCPDVQGFGWGVSGRVAEVATIELLRAEWGRLQLEEKLGELRFRVSPFSFFQTNTAGAKLLYDGIRELLELRPRHKLLDAYCGAGSIGIYCARDCAAVFGVESAREAVWDARHNARDNGLSNCTFVEADVRRALPLIRARGKPGGFDRMVVDPPRGGMHKKALAGLLELGVPLFVYVSCNPATLARDVQDIVAAGYEIARIRPYDLFPQTFHIETLIQFKKTCGSLAY